MLGQHTTSEEPGTMNPSLHAHRTTEYNNNNINNIDNNDDDDCISTSIPHDTRSIAQSKYTYQNKHMLIRNPKQHMSIRPCSNIHMSIEEGEVGCGGEQ